MRWVHFVYIVRKDNSRIQFRSVPSGIFDFLVWRGQIDCQFAKLGDGEIGLFKEGDQFLLSRLTKDDTISGKLSL